MFINNINPVLVNIGSLSIRYYGLVYAIGFLIGYLVLRRFIKSKKIKLTEEQLDTYFLWLIIGSIFMSRIFEVFIYNLPYYMSHISEIYKIWNGGLSFQGGIVGAIIVTIIFAKRYKVRFYDIADVLIIPTTLVLAIGKLANYTNSELYGRATNVPWCVVFQHVDNICRHPVQIYEFILYLAIFFILLTYYNHAHKNKHQINGNQVSGRIFWMFLILYSVARFFITFFRDEPQYFGLNVGQWLCLLTIIISGIVLWKYKPKNI